MTAVVAPPRRLASWIAGYEALTESSGSPLIFRQWCAISCIAGALERKTWVVSRQSKLFPNMYVFLVGPPGVGKSVAIAYTEQFWRTLPNHHVAPTSLTKAALIDALSDAKREIVRHGQNPPYVSFNSLLLCVSELGSFLTTYDNDFMSTLTTLYDGYEYAERRRTKDLKITIQEPQLNLLSGTTPGYMKSFLPEGAWDQGFLSRTMIVYSGQADPQDIFAEHTSIPNLREHLTHDIRAISELYGQFTVDAEARTAITAWHMAGGPPQPDHPRLVNYLTRRTAHLLKLCMVASVDRGNDLVISRSDFDIALHWLLDMETHIPDIFKAMVTGGDTIAMDECWHFVWQQWSREKRPILETRIVNFLKDRVPSHSVIRVLEVMTRSGMLKSQVTGAGMAYTPAPKNNLT